MNNVSHLDKVVIILSFLHKNDLELLRDFLAEFKLSDIDRQSIIERINQNPSFPVDQIQMVLKEFFELTQNEALFNMTNDVSNEIQQLVSSDEISVSKETIKESLFGGIANDVLFEFLDQQGEDVKGLLCHMLETDDLKKLFTLLPADKIGVFLKSYHAITPINKVYLDSFRQYLFSKIKDEASISTQAQTEKDSQFIQMLEMLDTSSLYKIENIEVNQRQIKDYKPYFIQPQDILLFNDEDRKIIVHKLLSNEILPQFMILIPEENVNELLSLLSSRNEAITKEDMDLYKGNLSEDQIEDIGFDFIKLIRQLQRSGEVDSSIKKTIVIPEKDNENINYLT